MNEPLVIGIDVGTSGARAVAMTPGFEISAVAAAKLADFSSDHRDPEGWRAAVEFALKALLAKLDRARVRAIAIDGTSGTVLAVDARGMPLAEPLMYNDPVTDEAILARIAEHAPADSAAHGATSGLAKALRFKGIDGLAHIVHQADWLMGNLTGSYDTSDENNALKTGYDPVARQWPEWLARTGMDRALLPRIVPAGAPVAPISPKAAAGFGLGADVVIVAGTTDGCASFLATGADRPGDGVTALGTTLTIKMLSGQPLFAPEFGLYSHRIGDMWLAGGASNSGGAVLARYFDNAAIERLSAEIDPSAETGLDYYPLPGQGERFPFNDPLMRPRMTPRPAGDAAFLQAIFEGIASIEQLAYGRLAELGAPLLQSVRSVGGGAKNTAWAAIRARRLGVPMPPVLSEEAAAGTARLALLGAREAGKL